MRRIGTNDASESKKQRTTFDVPSNTNSSDSLLTNGHSGTAVPGRARRKRSASRKNKHSIVNRLYVRWVKDVVTSFSSLFIAVLLWYILGVVSIATSKMLLTQHEHSRVGGVPPLLLTLQQLVIGSSMLRFLLKIRLMGSSGLQPWPVVSAAARNKIHLYGTRRQQVSMLDISSYQPSLLLAGVYFSLGFLATNYGFSAAAPSFVETIKAAEPITSATVAVWWGIEQLSREEVSSLAFIVMGVLLSTLGNGSRDQTRQSSLSDSFKAFMIVMVSNLCFSFRGLHQKLFRATDEGSSRVVDDLNLQYRMQQIGVVILIIPVVFFDIPTVLGSIWHVSTHKGIFVTGLLWRYISLSLLNGCAFTSYNLASTYILSRISVVHHATLNCIRRIFAIIVTSMLFGVPITWMGTFGIVVSVVAFMSFTHYKVQRQRQPKPLSSLLPISTVN